MNNDYKIDFVITWVDGNDEKWQQEKNKYLKNTLNDNKKNDTVRYREWDNLKYWFRAVEKFTPWVNKIYFVTYGHIPKWLNVDNPKLIIVNHKDYIPEEYLPTFSSHPIEFNIHRIKDLSEHFVYFNDDMFITNYMTKNDFFKRGLPRDIAVIQPVTNKGENNAFPHILLNNMRIINNHFSKKNVIKKNVTKWFNPIYGLSNFKSFFNYMGSSIFSGFLIPHIPTSYLKSSFNELWNKEFDIFNSTCLNKFRNNGDINHFVIAYYQMCQGKFYPRSRRIGKYFSISNNNKKICDAIKNKKYKLICLNDIDDTINYEKARDEVNSAFNEILPEKSSFEL